LVVAVLVVLETIAVDVDYSGSNLGNFTLGVNQRFNIKTPD